MAKVVQLWNPRRSGRLRRQWVTFDEQIFIAGADPEQSGVLSVRRAGAGSLRARLKVLGREFDEVVTQGQDITVWIHGLELVVGVRAIENDRMLVEFGVPSGSHVGVTLEPGPSQRPTPLS